MFTDKWPCDYTPRNIPEELHTGLPIDICTSVVIAALFTRAKGINNPGVHRQVTGLTECGANLQCNAINP